MHPAFIISYWQKGYTLPLLLLRLISSRSDKSRVPLFYGISRLQGVLTLWLSPDPFQHFQCLLNSFYS